MPASLRTWIEISQAALRNNYRIWRRLSAPSQLMAVVKSNAYGHGLIDFSLLMQKLGVDWFGVDSMVEALALRRAGVTKPILVLGYTLPENIKAAAANRVSLTISSFTALKEAANVLGGRRLKIHLKIDTGMHRQGFLLEEVSALLKFLKRQPNLKIEGLYTHLAAAKDPTRPEATLKQIVKFNAAVKIIEQAGFKPLKHAAATGGTLVFSQTRFDLVRIGIGLYGLWPSKETKTALARCFKPKPVLAWKTIISEVKRLPKGSGIGYDLTETLRRDSVIAICPVGYWHGLPWRLSSGLYPALPGSVLVKGQRAKILGRVCMDMIIIDVTDIPGPKAHDIVTIIGRQGSEEITVQELADLAGTSVYELVTRLNPLMKRIYV